MDSFLNLSRPPYRSAKPAPDSHASGAGHSLRKHAKLPASSMERIFNCPPSVELSEGMPDIESPAAREGTHCHEVLEAEVKIRLQAFPDEAQKLRETVNNASQEMTRHANFTANYIFRVIESLRNPDVMVEEKVSLEFLHPDAWGTLDYGILDHFGTLFILDFKYGTHLVSPKKNLQLLFYAIGVSHLHHWNFKRVRLIIMQPRAGTGEPVFWEIGIQELIKWQRQFQAAFYRVGRVQQFNEGAWCYFCKAKSKCPLKQGRKLEKAKKLFEGVPFNG